MIGKSDEEINQLLIQLKKNLEDVIAVDKNFADYFYLYRWLIKHQMKLDRTEKIIREAVVWRKANNVEELMNREWCFWSPGIEHDIRINRPGFSKLGQPVSTVICDDLDFRSLFEKHGKEAILKYHIQVFAKAEKALMDHYRRVSSEAIAMDRISKYETGYDPSWVSTTPISITSYKNFSMRNIKYTEDILEVARIGMAYFPENINTIYLINLNRFGVMALKLLKPIIGTDSRKVEFFDTDKAKWSKALLEIIEADQLQPYFGGTKSDAVAKFN